MRRLFRILASTRLTLVGMVLLAGGAGLSYDNPMSTPVWVLVVPMGFLAVNLFAAIVVHPRINRNAGLLMFHVGLLGICVLAAVGRLTYFEGRVELTQDRWFALADVEDLKQGPLHSGDIEDVRFVQGTYTVDYRPGLNRGKTRSQVRVVDADGRSHWREVGDDKPLVVNGYRFYTTFNKGFAAVLTWLPDRGQPITGVVHMPSYPLFEHRQSNEWTPPGSREIKFWLRLTTGFDEEDAWVLNPTAATGILVVNDTGSRVELAEGEEVVLPGGRLRFEALSTWMGYKIFYDPTLLPLFAASVLAVLGLMQHYWRKFGHQPLAATNQSTEPDGPDTAPKSSEGQGAGRQGRRRLKTGVSPT